MTLPESHVLLRAGRVRAAVRRDLVSALGDWLLAPDLDLPPAAERIGEGRGGAFRIGLPGGLRAVVRQSRRGGALARVVRETYLGVVPRPLRELIVAAEARRRGVPTPEVLAVRVEGRFVYRSTVVTAEIAGGRTLVDALRAADGAGERAAVAAGAGRTVGVMHRAGLVHADLNCTNLLVHPGPGLAPAVAVLDLDRARLRRPPLAGAARRRMLARLERSLRKLDPAGTAAAPADVAAFRVAYGRALGAACAC